MSTVALAWGLVVAIWPITVRAEPPPGSHWSVLDMARVARSLERRGSEDAKHWAMLSERFRQAVGAGQDPYVTHRGQVAIRAYLSKCTHTLQRYAVYLPRDYDPARRYPLIVALHGGSSNGHLFLNVFLGNNLPWERYRQMLWSPRSPRWYPDAVIVAPDGYGQVLWRWMGEQDVLDVVDDAVRHYSVDPSRVALMGLSNGGMGAYAVGIRHASRFSSVVAMAGSPSWVRYAGGRALDFEEPLLEGWSAMDLLENARNTRFLFFHGDGDTGPMRPVYIRELERRLDALGPPLAMEGHWYRAGHDILYRVTGHGDRLARFLHARDTGRPRRVRVVSRLVRAAEQYWLRLERLAGAPASRAEATAEVSRETLRVRTKRVRGFSLGVAGIPWQTPTIKLEVDGQSVYRGLVSALGHRVYVSRGDGGRWALGWGGGPDGVGDGTGLRKRRGLSGPLTDAYYHTSVHVFGTLVDGDRDELRRAAERGARGWPLWLWNFRQPVVADTEVTDAMMRGRNVVLYGNERNNRVLRGMASALPIRVTGDRVVLGTDTISGASVGTRFVFPNPRAPGRYVVVQGGTDLRAVRAGHHLPDFLPDYVVFQADAFRKRGRLTAGRGSYAAAGFFTDRWTLKPAQ